MQYPTEGVSIRVDTPSAVSKPALCPGTKRLRAEENKKTGRLRPGTGRLRAEGTIPAVIPLERRGYAIAERAIALLINK